MHALVHITVDNVISQSPDNSEPEDDTSPAGQLHWRLNKRQDPGGRGQTGVASSCGEDSDDEAEEDEAGNETLNTTVTEGTSKCSR